ncbi:MAG: ATP-binding protein, partial [Alphaproteobacteria bacterium]
MAIFKAELKDGAVASFFSRLWREASHRMQSEVTLRGSNHLAISRAEARANWAENRLREALNVLPEGIVFLDAEGRYVLWNDAYAEIYEKSADLFREGVRLIDTLRVGVARGDYPQAIGREEGWLAERMALLDNPGVRHEQQLANGRWIMIEERKTNDGGTIGIRIDISEMKAQAERLEAALNEAKAASQAKSDFLANMSHEIRTPLNGVIGLADVLSRTRLDESQREILHTVMASAGDLNNLLGDLLDFSKAEAGKLTLEATEFDLGALAEACVGLYRLQAQTKGIELGLTLSADVEGQVRGDPARVRQILNNLISNAVKFTSAGRIRVNISRTAAGACLMEVNDTGAGFDQSHAERLFARFEQADGSTTRQFGGTGLGLSICRQLAGLMGGSITARGHRGKGATFTVILPLPPVEALSEPPVGDPDPGTGAAGAAAGGPMTLAAAFASRPVAAAGLGLLMLGAILGSAFGPPSADTLAAQRKVIIVQAAGAPAVGPAAE